LKLYNDYRLADPFLLPNWRQERVLRIVSSIAPARIKRWDDEWILAYRKFFLSYRRGESAREELMHEQPGLYFAQQIHERTPQNPDMALLLQARLLTGASDEEVAHLLKTIPQTVFWYERLFFNVRDFLDHSDWVVRSVLLPASDRFVATSDEAASDRVDGTMPATPVNPHFDMSLKYFSYFGGAMVCDLMISGFLERRNVMSPKEIVNFFDDYFTHQIRRRSAIASRLFEVNKYNVMELFNTHTRLMEIQANSKDTEERHTQLTTAIKSMLSVASFSVGRANSKDTGLSEDYDRSANEFDSDSVSQAELGNAPRNMLALDNVSAFAAREPLQTKRTS